MDDNVISCGHFEFYIFGGNRRSDVVVPAIFEISTLKNPQGQIFMFLCRCAHIKGCSSEKPHSLVDGNQFFFSGEGGGIQTAQICGVYWSDVPGNPGWMMFMRFPLSVWWSASIGNFM